MSEQPTPSPARAFGGVAEAYERGRPTYPRDAAVWLTEPPETDRGAHAPLSILELGAGTGKLTRTLVELGHDVHATDPDEAMLAILERELPTIRTTACGAERIEAADASYDVVVAAQCFHWFDRSLALPEIARVLKPGGTVALVWNQRDERIPWVRRLGGIIGTQEQLRDPANLLVESRLFGFVEESTHRFWQTVDRRSIQDLVVSRSNIAVLDEERRAAKLAEVLAFYDDYGRGMDGMQLPYAARCFRATVSPDVVRAVPTSTTALVSGVDETGDVSLGTVSSNSPSSPAATPSPWIGEDTEMLLIDFR